MVAILPTVLIAKPYGCIFESITGKCRDSHRSPNRADPTSHSLAPRYDACSINIQVIRYVGTHQHFIHGIYLECRRSWCSHMSRTHVIRIWLVFVNESPLETFMIVRRYIPHSKNERNHGLPAFGVLPPKVSLVSFVLLNCPRCHLRHTNYRKYPCCT
jgi:hypothetical protein